MLKDVFDINGTTLSGAFLVERVVAEGGFGVVYRAEHIAFRAPVALKCLKVPSAITNEQREAFVESFREEAEMLFHLSAQIPEVVRPLHADAVKLPNGTTMPFIAMEWVDGTPLDAIIVGRENRGEAPLTLDEAIAMLSPIAHALDRAHRFELATGGALSIVHCDLKPENVLILDRGPVTAKLLDFGIAKARELATSYLGRITESDGARPFTPGYGAPEQWLPKRYGTTGPWTDVWAMALTLVECITGRAPIDGDLQGMMGTAIDRGRRPTPRAEGAVVSDAVEAVFAKALAVDPKERYTRMAAFWGDLERAQGVAPSDELRGSEKRGRASPSPTKPQARETASNAPTIPSLRMPDAETIQTLRSVGEEFELELDLDRSDRAATRPSAPVGGSASVRGNGPNGPNRVAVTEPLRIELDGPRSSTLPFQPPRTAITAKPRRAEKAASGRTALILAAKIFAVGLAVVALDAALTVAWKAPVALGPVRLRWLGAIPVGVGLVLALASFASTSDE